MSSPKRRECAYCNQPLVGLRKNAKHCSASCKTMAFRKRVALEVRHCAECNESFTSGPRGSKKYCSRICAKRADNARQREHRRAEEAAAEILRQKAAGKLKEAEFKEAAERILNGEASIVPPVRSRKKTSEPSALDQIQQALYDAEATRLAQIPRREPPGFDAISEFAYDPHFLRRERAVDEHLRLKRQASGQGPSLETMGKIRDAETKNE